MLKNCLMVLLITFSTCLVIVTLYFSLLNRDKKIGTTGVVSNIFIFFKIGINLFFWVFFGFILNFSIIFYLLGAGYFALSKYTLFLYSFLGTLVLVTFIYLNPIILLIVKKSRLIKILYWKQKKQLTILKRYFKISFVKLIDFCSLIYKNHILTFIFFFFLFTIYLKTYILFFVYCIYVLQQLTLELPFFKGFREEHKEDEGTYSFHWSNDRDLVFFDVFLSKLTYISYFLTFFSYFFKVAPLINANSLYFLECENLLYTISELQLFLAFKLVGPLLYLFSGILRLLLGLHVIFFRNPRTKKPFVAAAKVSLKFAKVYGTGVAITTGVTAGYVEYRTGGIDSLLKKKVDEIFDGVIRINKDQEREFIFLKDKGIKLPRDDMREEGNHIFDKWKVAKKLSLPENASELAKLTPKDLNELDMVALIPENKVLLHNLQQYEKICAGKGNISGYIYSFSGEERDKVLSGTKNPANLEDFHHSIKRFVITARSTPAGRIDYEEFMSGKSINLMIVWKYGKSL